jgi:hypothetical protein
MVGLLNKVGFRDNEQPAVYRRRGTRLRGIFYCTTKRLYKQEAVNEEKKVFEKGAIL